MNIETQVFLNYFLDGLIEPLRIDGVIGTKTREAIDIAINLMKKKYKDNNLSFNDSFTFTGIRSSYKVTDLYDDWFVIISNNTLTAFPASTKAGKPAIAKYWNRIVKGIRGFGTLQANQQIDYLLVKGTSSGWASWTGGLGFLFQDKPIKVYRDPNLDDIIDKSLFVVSQGDGFNIHSWKGVNAIYDTKLLLNTFAKQMNLTNKVHNMSEGCQVTLANYWTILFNILEKNATTINNQKRIIYTLIDN